MGGAASTPVPAELKRDEALALVAQHFDTLAAGAETVARDKLAASLAALTCANPKDQSRGCRSLCPVGQRLMHSLQYPRGKHRA